jgi:hypothetical protein
VAANIGSPLELTLCWFFKEISKGPINPIAPLLRQRQLSAAHCAVHRATAVPLPISITPPSCHPLCHCCPLLLLPSMAILLLPSIVIAAAIHLASPLIAPLLRWCWTWCQHWRHWRWQWCCNACRMMACTSEGLTQHWWVSNDGATGVALSGWQWQVVMVGK